MNPKIHNLSLQGITGIFLGILCLIYVYLVSFLINEFTSSSGSLSVLPISFFELFLVAISILFLVVSYFIITLINRKKRKKINLKRWEFKSKRIRRTFLIHLIFGGIIIYIFINQGLIKLIIPTSLLLYGISCIIVNNQTFGKTNYLGGLFIINGILSILFPSQLFLLWSLAFGGYHILYGMFYFNKINSNN